MVVIMRIEEVMTKIDAEIVSVYFPKATAYTGSDTKSDADEEGDKDDDDGNEN